MSMPMNFRWRLGRSKQCAAVLHIPIAKCRSGAIMPYGGDAGHILSLSEQDDLLLAEGLSADA